MDSYSLSETEPFANSAATHGQQTDDGAPVSRLHDLLRTEVLAAFDRASFEREGYWVWEGCADRRRPQAVDSQPAETTADER